MMARTRARRSMRVRCCCAPRWHSPLLRSRSTTRRRCPIRVLQQRYYALTHELRCMQCQNEALADSSVSLAADLRLQVRELLLAGQSDDQIRDHMVARYGEFILFRPRMIWRNAWLWAARPLLMLVGLIVGWRVRARALAPGGQRRGRLERRVAGTVSAFVLAALLLAVLAALFVAWPLLRRSSAAPAAPWAAALAVLVLIIASALLYRLIGNRAWPQLAAADAGNADHRLAGASSGGRTAGPGRLAVAGRGLRQHRPIRAGAARL